jgi:hypothetical protein
VLTAAVVDADLAAYLGWPGARQVFQVQRRVVVPATGEVREETVYGISSLAREQANARQLAQYVRQHWHIENRSHWVRDVTFGEDGSRVRTAPIPQVLAALRNAVIGLLHAHGHTRIKAAILDLQANPWEALALLGITRDN